MDELISYEQATGAAPFAPLPPSPPSSDAAPATGGYESRELTVRPRRPDAAVPPPTALAPVDTPAGGKPNSIPADWISYEDAVRPPTPHPGGVLSNTADDGYLSGFAKGAGTAGIKGGAHALGGFTDLSDFAKYIGDRGEQGIRYLLGHPKPLEQIQADNEAARQQFQRMQQETVLGRISNAFDPMRILPKSSDIAEPILSRTGEYVPTTKIGRMTQAGAEAALSTLGPGAGVASGPASTILRAAPHLAAGNAVAGSVGQGITESTGDPLLGMVAGGLAVPAAGAAAAGVKKTVAPLVMGTPGLQRVPVIGPKIGEARDQAAGQKLLDASSDPAALRQWADAFGQAKANPQAVPAGGYSLRPEDPAVTATMPADPTRFRYDIMKDGQSVGFMNVSVNGDTATINNIRANGPIGDERGRFGTTAVAQLMRDFAARHPDVMTIAGNRVSGARQAGQMVDDELGKPVQVSVPQPTPVVADSPRTLAGTLGKDRGLFQAEKAARGADNTTFNAMDDAQATAQRQAITAPYRSGDVFRPGQVIRERLNAIDAAHADAEAGLRAAHDQAVASRKDADQRELDRLTVAYQGAHDQAALAATDAAAPLNALPHPEVIGETYRTAHAEATEAARRAKQAVYDLVDPEGTLAAVVTPLKEAKNRIAAAIDPHTGVQPSGAEAELWQTIDRLPDVIPFRSLQKLDSRVTTAMTNERKAQQKGESQDPEAIGRLTQLKGAVLDAIHDGAQNAAAHEARLVQAGVLAPERAMPSRIADWIDTHYARQAEARNVGVAGRRDGAEGPAGGRSANAPGSDRAESQRAVGFGGAPRDQGVQAPPRTGAQQPGGLTPQGSVAYQAPDLGSRSVSARMHAPETAAALGQDVPGTVVRPYGGPLDRRLPAGEPGIVAYHGSPHDFERFSSAHIGTGEGNQAYGRGLYFGEERAVGEKYRDQLSTRDADVRLNNQGFRRADLLGDVRDAFDHVKESGGKIDEAVREARDAFGKKLRAGDMEAADFWMRRATTLEDMKDRGFAMGGAGHLYQVKINRPSDHFLDWDKPIGAQSEYVQKVLQSPEIRPLVEAHQERIAGAGAKHFYGANIFAGLDPRSRVAATQKLRDAGIAGIRYLDRDSRSVGEGTRNLVVFNDHDIHVTHKNDVALARPVALPQMLMGQARASWGEELRGADVRGDSFSPDLTRNAMKLVGEGRHLDHGTAYENAFIKRMPQEDVNAVERGTVPSRGSTAAGAGATRASERGGPGNAGEGRGQPGQDRSQSREDLAPNFDQDAVDRLSAAKQAHIAFERTFNNPIVEPILAHNGYVGQYTLPSGAIPSKAIVSGDKGYETAKAFIDASGRDPRAIAAMQDASLSLLRKHFPPAGTLHPNAVARWKEHLDGALRAIDEVAPGFSGKFDNAANATQAMLDLGLEQKQAIADFRQDAAARALELDKMSETTMQAGLARAKGMISEARNSPAGKFLGQGGDRISPVEVENAVGNMLKTGTSGATRMRSLVASVASDPDALAGLQKAGTDWMVRTFATADDGMAGAKFIKFYRDNKHVLIELYGTAHTNMIGGVASDMERNARWRTTTAAKGGSDTSPNMRPWLSEESKQAAKHISLMTAAIEGLQAGYHIGGLKGAVVAAAAPTAYLLHNLRSAGIHSVDALYREALANPEVARRLISKMPPVPEGAPPRQLVGLLRRELIVGPQEVEAKRRAAR